MGSSHSYLQNLESTASVYTLEDGLCIEFAVPVSNLTQALTYPGATSGVCSNTEYTKFNNIYMTKSPFGILQTGVW